MEGDLRAPLDVHSLRAALQPPWRRLDVVVETGSTNADLVGRAAAGEELDGSVLIAEHQTAGRGRLGRTWTATPRTQVIMSVAVSARDVPAAGWGWLPLATGVAVVDAVSALANVDAGVKWPNDVLVGTGKLAGILAEVASVEPVIVVGLGLNVTLTPGDVDGGGATSLSALDVTVPSRAALVTRLLSELGQRVDAWRAAGGADRRLRDDYTKHSLTIGNHVRATMPGRPDIIGIARSVDEQGRLCIESNGEILAVSAGDVVHLRGV